MWARRAVALAPHEAYDRYLRGRHLVSTLKLDAGSADAHASAPRNAPNVGLILPRLYVAADPRGRSGVPAQPRRIGTGEQGIERGIDAWMLIVDDLGELKIGHVNFEFMD